MNKTKRIVACLLAAIMLLGLLAVGAGAESTSYIPEGVGGRTAIPTTYSVETVIMEIEAGREFTYYRQKEAVEAVDDEGYTYTINSYETITIKPGDVLEMTAPEDIFIDSENNIYVADTKNSRIIKFNRSQELLGVWSGTFLNVEKDAQLVTTETYTEIEEREENGVKVEVEVEKEREVTLKKKITVSEFSGFSGPKGIFVADFEDNNIYVADTDNKRIIALDRNGDFVRLYGIPTSDLITDTEIATNYAPAKMVKTKTGYLYVVVKESVMTLDDNNVFQGYYGQASVAFDLQLAIYRSLGLEAYIKNVTKTYASFYLNLTLGSDGLIYAVTQDTLGGEIKKLNSVGENIYKNYGGGGGGSIYDSLVASFFSSATNPLALFFAKTSLLGDTFWFGERVNEDGLYVFPVFADICVDKNGILTILERNNGKLYQYDQEGNCLTVFGGLGDSKGTFEYPESIAVDSDGNIYVLDKNLTSVQIFKPTAFIKTVHEAVNYYSNGQYALASDTWVKVLAMTSTYELAHEGLARTEYKAGNYGKAMDLYYLAQDRAGYSTAFSAERREIFRDYFALVIIGVVAVFVAIVFIVKGITKTADAALSFSSEEGRRKWSVKKNAQIMVGTLRSPFKLYDRIKGSNEKLRWWPAIVVFALVVVVRIAYIYLVHYPLADIEPRNANVLLEMLKMLLPPITWAAASIAITSIWDGESRLKEIFYATAMAEVPYIFITTLLIPLSHIMCQDEYDIYSSLIQIASVWVFFLIVGSLKTLNDYSVGKTIRVGIVIGIMMLLIWMVCILALTLIGQVFGFIDSIIVEIRMILL